jgi:transcriptional regulator with XRE-family HTH domain
MLAAEQTNAQQTFGGKLRHLRNTRRVGLRALAASTGIDFTALSRMENGRRRPPELGTLARIAVALGMVEGTTDFLALWALAERERNPLQAQYAEKVFSDLAALEGVVVIEAAKPDSVSSERDYPVPVLCRSLAELISKSNKLAIDASASEITVKSKSGVTKFLYFPAHGITIEDECDV